MHSDDYPVEGCYCCDHFAPVSDTKHNYSIYQTCVEGTGVNKKDYQECFNNVNAHQHNAKRKLHSRPSTNANPETEADYKLEIDANLAKLAKARAEYL